MGAFQLELDLKKNQVPFLREVTEQADKGRTRAWDMEFRVQGLGCFQKGTPGKIRAARVYELYVGLCRSLSPSKQFASKRVAAEVVCGPRAALLKPFWETPLELSYFAAVLIISRFLVRSDAM